MHPVPAQEPTQLNKPRHARVWAESAAACAGATSLRTNCSMHATARAFVLIVKKTIKYKNRRLRRASHPREDYLIGYLTVRLPHGLDCRMALDFMYCGLVHLLLESLGADMEICSLWGDEWVGCEHSGCHVFYSMFVEKKSGGRKRGMFVEKQMHVREVRYSPYLLQVPQPQGTATI